MGDLDFDKDAILEQARGNQSAIWHLAARWAREREGSVDGWASFVAKDFAPSWDDMGEDASALDVARMAGLNMATTADMRPVALEGDEGRASLTLEGPDQEWLEGFGTTVSDLDRTNEIVFRAIAERRGLTLDLRRDGQRLEMVFAR